MKSMKLFKDWEYPEFDEKGMTKWNWMCQYHESLKLGRETDIGTPTYVNMKMGLKYRNKEAR